MTRDTTAMSPSTAPTTKPHLTAAQLLAHPAFSTNDWSAKIPPTTSGDAPINTSSTRPGGPFTIHYQIHGHGPTKVVWLMGLGGYHTAWKRQTKFFGHEHADEYTSLVFDNRGVGRSGKPLCRYSSREMAADVVELLGAVGWLEKATVEAVIKGFYAKKYVAPKVSEREKRVLNVAGVSMGGMIAQEVGLLIPECIQSLVLVSTAPRLVRTVPFMENLKQRAAMFIPKDIDVTLDEISHRLFSKEFLEMPDTENEDPKLNFPTNRDRFASTELAKRADKEGFTGKGFILQAIAAGWHHKSKEQLQELVAKVGGDRIVVLHGMGDDMITFRHFELFKEDMGTNSGVTYLQWENLGHVLPWEIEAEFNETIRRNITRTQKLSF